MKKHRSEIAVDEFFKTPSRDRQLTNRNNWEYASEFVSKTNRTKCPTPSEIEDCLSEMQDICDEDGEFEEVFLDETTAGWKHE